MKRTASRKFFTRSLDKLEAIRPFSEAEAWGLFRIVAIGEAIGWTTLIIGIAIQKYHLAGSHYSVPIAGQIHGTIFIAYFAILLATYSSLGWSRFKFLIAIGSGIPPYGTLVFELYTSHIRGNKRSREHFRSVYFTHVAKMAHA